MSNILRIELLFALVILGYVVALPVVYWALYDARTLSRRVWASYGRRRSHWEHQLFITYAFGGWPAIIFALSWRSSRLRHELRRERATERERGRF